MPELYDNSVLMQVISGQDCIQSGLKSLNKKLKVLKEEADWRKSRYETTFAQERVIIANDSYLTAAVNNPNYNRARVFVAANFTQAHSSGLEISMVFQNSMVGTVMDMIVSNGAAGKMSEPIDVKELSSFQIQIHNRDSLNSTILRNVRVILYNDY